MSKRTRKNNTNNIFGLDIVAATHLLKSEQYGAWYRDPWNFPELDTNFTETLDAPTLGVGKTPSGINFTIPPSFLPFDFPKSFFSTRPAVTQDLQSSLVFAAAALQVAPSLHESLEDWVYGWRMRIGEFAGQSSNEWAEYIKTKKDIQQSEYSAQTDITSCFASIDHEEISDFVYKTVGKTTAANIIASVLEQHATTPGRRGLPQRSNAASILAQLAFYYIDLRIAERLSTGQIISARRWMDDISFEGNYEELHDLLTIIQNEARRFGLEINTSKTNIVTSDQLVQEMEEEEHKLIEVEPVMIDEGYDEPSVLFYDYSPLVDLEEEILQTPSSYSRPTIGRVLKSLKHHGIYKRLDEWADQAPRMPHAADRIGRFLLAGRNHQSIPIDLSAWATRSISSPLVSLPWVRAQYAISVPSTEVQDDLREILWSWLSQGTSIHCLAVAADRLSRLDPKAFKVRAHSIIDENPGPQRDRILAFSLLAAGAPRSQVARLLRRNPANNITLRYLEWCNWRTPKTAPDYDASLIDEIS
ncbi:RNA-directed DNA polymerase [Actinomyces oris]|uniref:RNA-directed DNA polymerase n=1 Tax=Actinomyces oris TaxID=544580 RepID=A0AAW8L4N3_9ACTO|nr:RNA-directed DNA polymerase [Actinomyces oris]MDR0177022.1 RNA-directed DNA polymerase [Actinomyces oris]